jgi:hypothetical protein
MEKKSAADVENDAQAYRAMGDKTHGLPQRHQQQNGGKVAPQSDFSWMAVISAFSTYVCDSSRVAEECREVTTLGKRHAHGRHCH